ncbi:hypothetical protein L596_001402 [Steinernema carpocapsae]|uniref:Secreted protein n=1 Tax=Steinernema carpocapsae TaxID=34508 RepID=A0A4U8UKY3_STECR|nr:hypothetical protein L596_001402 [Steinernema carpocapsae]
MAVAKIYCGVLWSLNVCAALWSRGCLRKLDFGAIQRRTPPYYPHCLKEAASSLHTPAARRLRRENLIGKSSAKA